MKLAENLMMAVITLLFFTVSGAIVGAILTLIWEQIDKGLINRKSLSAEDSMGYAFVLMFLTAVGAFIGFGFSIYMVIQSPRWNS